MPNLGGAVLRFRKGLVLLALCVASACGDAADVQGVAVAQADGGNRAGGVQQGNRGTIDATLALVAAYCTRLYACQPHDAAIDYTSPSVCGQRELVRILAVVGATGATSNNDTLAACAKWVNDASCDAIHYGGPPRCYFGPGTRANDKPCAWDSQCQGKVCVRKGAETCGVCATEGQVGDSCSPRTCAAGLACVFDAEFKKYRCRARAKLGEPCNAGVKYEPVCGYGLVCTGSTCAPAGSKGAPCPSGGCDHDLGLDCHKESKQCTPIPKGTPGATCSINGIGHDLYKECHDGLCLNRNDMGNGTCTAYAPDGGKCGGWSGPACRVPAVCVQGTCRVLSGAECL